MLSINAWPLSLLFGLEAAALITLTSTSQVSSNTAAALPAATYINYDSTSRLLSTPAATNDSTSRLPTSIATSNRSTGPNTVPTASAPVTYLTGKLRSPSTSINGTVPTDA